CSSHKAAGGRPAKRMKCETSSLKSELEGLTCGSENLAALGERPETSAGDRGSEDPGDSNTVRQKEGEGIPEAREGEQGKEQDVSLEPQAVEPSSAALSTGRGQLWWQLWAEDSSGGSVPGDTGHPRELLEHGGLSDEDSNQPMPVHRFFGDVELVRGAHLPAVALPSTTRSRREVRKLHFVAKEDEEEEEEDV
ncbi:CA174 protein, partial [Smithornis capensis]|nr:CA174 protein [Smithornis capensis]